MEGYERIVYSLNVFDIQRVAVEEFGRALTEDELKTTEDSLGDYIHWYDANKFLGGVANAPHASTSRAGY